MDKIAIQAISKPKIIIEVLSPSTEALDRGDKFKLRSCTNIKKLKKPDFQGLKPY
jgi:hypothetical protein